MCEEIIKFRRNSRCREKRCIIGGDYIGEFAFAKFSSRSRCKRWFKGGQHAIRNITEGYDRRNEGER